MDAPNDQRRVFVDWAPHCSRSDNIASKFGMEIVRHFRPRRSLFSLPYKYLYQVLATLRDLYRLKPSRIVCMSPSPFTALPVWIYCCLSSARFAIDAHTGAFLGWPWERYPRIQRFFAKRADYTFVTNDEIARLVRQAGGRPLIVPDVPTELDSCAKAGLPDGFNAVFVASFGPDEPIRTVVEAASILPDVNFHITGTMPRSFLSEFQRVPGNVFLTGFLSRAKYLGTVAEADVVLALTNRNHTMQRAAYESIYLGTPVILSDWPILRENFDGAAIFTDHDPRSLADAIQRSIRAHDSLKRGAIHLRAAKLARWANNHAEIEGRFFQQEVSEG